MSMNRLCLRSLLAIFSLAAMSPVVVRAAEAPAAAASSASTNKEPELLAVLSSSAPSNEKAIACKQLAIHGTSAAVPELAKLLPNDQLSSWARIALEAIPGPEADAALRTAADSLQGRLAIGMINSIGVRRDAGAVESLTARLKDQDAEVASAAAVALGRIGNEPATASLTQALAGASPQVRSAVAEGCVLCAEQLHLSGKSDAAAVIYDQVRAADVPQQRKIEATRGAILARGEGGLPLLLEQFHSSDKAMFNLALMTAREFPGGEVDKALVTELGSTSPERAAVIVQAMADRPSTVVLAAVLKAAEAGPTVVRLSAIDALSRIGNESCFTALLAMAAGTDADLAPAAKETLAKIPGREIDAQVIAQLATAEGPSYPALLDLVGRRRINAIPQLEKALGHSDAGVRSAALNALGETVKLENLSVLISQVVAPKQAEDAAVAEKALMAASIRMPDRESCAAELTKAIDSTRSVATKGSLLSILGAMGGTRALATVAAAAGGKDAQLQDISSRLLGEWMTEDAAPVLLDLAQSPTNQYQIRAIRGYIRIVRQFVLPDAQRAEMCQKAFDLSRQPAEKKLVLEILKRYPTIDMLKQAIAAMQIPELKADAEQAVLAIAQKLGNKGVDVKDLVSQVKFGKSRVEILKAEYGAEGSRQDVTAILQKQAGEQPLISLPEPTYSASFGGDPAPGAAKQLKVQYRINDKTGELTFAENALLVFPIPQPKK